MCNTMNEYDSLRNEIISMEEQQRNVWIYMYVSYTTLFILGMQISYTMFLVTYIILIPFQIVMNRYRWSITKMSTYIRIFYEENNEQLNWENMHVYHGYTNYYKKINAKIDGIVRYTGAAQLGFLATSFYIAYLLYNRFNNGAFTLNIIDIITILLAIGLFFLTVVLSKNYYKSHTEEIESIIRDYKDNLNKK